MNSPRPSLASLLAYRDPTPPEESVRQAPPGQSEEALATYLRDYYHVGAEDGAGGASAYHHGASSQPKADVFHYHNPTTQSSMLHSNDSASTPTLQTGGRLPTLGPGAGISPPHRSPSPMNPAISIPSALAELATSALSVAVPLTSDTPDERAARELIDDYEMRGEMGGKRRKPLHERAGWKEMDEQGVRKRGRRRRESSPEEFGVYIDPATGAGTLENDLIRANREMGLPTNLPLSDEVTFAASVDPQLQLAGSGSGDDGDFAAGDRGGVQQGKSGGLSSNSKESRAEQNRRAQQAFRRRREEHIKKLESDSAALGPTLRRLEEAHYKLRELALSYEATQIEVSALRAALRTASLSSGTSVLTPDGTLVVNASSTKLEGPNEAEDIEAAYGVLERQARELAKQNRAKRDS